jgi:hypothetical protein
VQLENQTKLNEKTNPERDFKSFYLAGAICGSIAILGNVADIIIGTALGGDLTLLPGTAAGRFMEFNRNVLLGLYHFDLLNAATTVILLPAFYSLYLLHRAKNYSFSLFALIVFCIGTAVFLANNSALTMMDLSRKYFSAASEEERMFIAAAGEAMLAKGAHGSPSVFIGFILPIAADIIISFVMLYGKVFNRVNSYLGIAGNIFLLLYIILVTFFPDMKNIAMLIAAPGGILVILWMVLFTLKLFRLARQTH